MVWFIFKLPVFIVSNLRGLSILTFRPINCTALYTCRDKRTHTHTDTRTQFQLPTTVLSGILYHFVFKIWVA